jgi:hypothetical protein
MSVSRVSNATAATAVAGLHMVTPTSVVVGSGTGSVSGQGAVTFTSVSSVSLNGCFSANYDNYKIITTFVGTNNSAVNLRLRNAGTDLVGTGYVRQRAQFDGTGSAISRGTGGVFDFGATRVTTPANFYELTVVNPFISSQSKTFSYQGYDLLSGGSLEVGAGNNPVSGTYDGLTIFPNAGTFTGTIRVYGYNNGGA